MIAKTKEKYIDNKYKDEDRQVLQEITLYLKSLYQRYRIDVSDKGHKVIMGGLNTEEETNDLYMNMQKIKTFLQIKGRKHLLRGLDGMEQLQEDLKFRFLKMNNHLDILEKQNQTLIDVNKEVNSKILGRIKTVAFDTANIKTERVHTKEEIFETIEKELATLEGNALEEKTNLEEQLSEMRAQSKVQQLQIMEFEREKEDPREYADKGVQLQIENLMEFKEADDLANFHSNLNMFIADGKAQSVDWVEVLITDICSSKLIADYRDYKSK